MFFRIFKDKLRKNDELLKIFEQNCLHVRHVENERMVFLNSFVVIIAAIISVITLADFNKFYIPYMVGFLFIFSLLILLISLKIEAIIEDYTTRNEKIIKKLELEQYAGLRVKFKLWKALRLKFILPSLYGLICLAIGVWFTLILLGIVK